MTNRKKFKYFKKMTGLMTAVILAASMFFGCGKDKIPESEEITDISQDESEQSLKSKLGVPDGPVTYNIGETTLSVDVDFPDCSSVGVYELERVALTSEYMSQMAENIFDGGEYQIIWPCYIMTEEQIREAYQEKSEIVQAFDSEDEDSYLSNFVYRDWCRLGDELDNWADHNTELEVENPGDTLAMYSNGTDSEGTEATGYVFSEGTINGESYRLSFAYDNNDSWIYITLVKERDFRYNNNNISYTEEYVDLLSMEKNISYTEEESCELAANMIEKMGFTDTGLLYKSFIPDTFDDDVLCVNGYRFVYGFCKNDVSMLYSVDNPTGGLIYVDIGNEGLLRLKISVPYQISSCLEEDTELLSFSQIQEIAQPVLEDNDLMQYFKQITFGYTITEYEGKKVLIPVWTYMGWGGNAYEPPFCILHLNAIDGSFVIPEQVGFSSAFIDF